MNIKAGWLSILILALVGCSKPKEVTPIQYVPAKNEVLTREDLTPRIQEFLKARYTKYDEMNKCWIHRTKDGFACVTLHIIGNRETNTNSYIYVVESGSPLEPDGTLANFHASSGVMTLFMFGETNHQLNLMAQSDEIANGSYGYPNEVKTYRVGNDGQLGWLLNDGGGNMGVFGGVISLYLQKDNRITEVATINNFFSNTGACGDPSSQICDIEDLNSVIETVYDGQQRFFDIQVSTRKESKAMGKPAVVKNTVKLIQFNEQKFAYELGDVNQPYAEH
jgi:hypothetical protein